MYFGFEDITVSFGGRKILDSVTLSVPRGKIVTLIGKNGCGKSTLLKTVPRAVVPQAGRVVFDGSPLRSYAPKKLAQKIAYLAQVHESPADIDVRTLVSYGRYPYLKFGRTMTAADADVIDAAIDAAGLTALSTQPLRTLSGGERQRAWIAMTVAQQPEILILDEPTTYLDIGYQIEVLELVRRLNRERGMTVLMVLHDVNLAARYSDWLCALRDTHLFTEGTPETVITAQNLQALFGISAQIIRDPVSGCPYFIPGDGVVPPPPTRSPEGRGN